MQGSVGHPTYDDKPEALWGVVSSSQDPLAGPGEKACDCWWPACLSSFPAQPRARPALSVSNGHCWPCPGLASGPYLSLPPAWGQGGHHPSFHPISLSSQPCPVVKLPARHPCDALSLWLQKEKLSAQASLKRHTSLNDLSLTRDEQEIEFLRLQVLEQQHVIDDLSLVRSCLVTPLDVAPSDSVSGMH